VELVVTLRFLTAPPSMRPTQPRRHWNLTRHRATLLCCIIFTQGRTTRLPIGWWAALLPGSGVVEVRPAGAVQRLLGRADRQACIAGSRLLLEEPIAAEFLDRFVALAASLRIGDPLQRATELGPLTSPEHRDRVLAYVKVAREEGGEVLLGGRAPKDPALARGCYVEPTVVRAGPADRVNREEVFGPFVSVLTFRGEEEALALANGVGYGLGGGLWTRDLQRAHRTAAAIRSGMVWVNSYKRVSPGSPFGGVGDSGYGREMGFEAMHGYTEPKSVWVNVDADLPAWYPR
jgi:aldehyde dehydrogenase (NAD+)